MSSFKTLLLALSLCISIPLSASAQSYPDYTSLYVNDFADIIDAQTENRIEQTLRKAKQDRDLEITVVTINARADYGNSTSFKAFATGLFNHWGVGDAARNDGILILVSKTDREMRIVLGDGYPPRYDDRAKTVIDHHFLPAFRKNEYARGIEAGTNETLKRLTLDFDETGKASLRSRLQNETYHAVDDARNGGVWAWIFGALGLGGAGGGFRLFRRWQRLRPRKCDLCSRKMRRLSDKDEDAYLAKGQLVEEALNSKDYDVWYCTYDERTRIEGYRKWFSSYTVCPSCNYRTLNSIQRTIVAATTSSTGTAEVTYDCYNCDHHAVETVILPIIDTSSSSSGGSGGGFGGGSSSGGGAGGSW